MNCKVAKTRVSTTCTNSASHLQTASSEAGFEDEKWIIRWIQGPIELRNSFPDAPITMEQGTNSCNIH